MVEKRIEPNRKYTLMDIVGLQLPFARNYRTVRSLVDLDRQGANVMQAQVTDAGGHQRTLVRGSRLLKYLQTYGQILQRKARQPKKQHGKKRSAGHISKAGKSAD